MTTQETATPVRLICFATALPQEVKQECFPAAHAKVMVKEVETLIDYANKFYKPQKVIIAPDVHITPLALPSLPPHVQPDLHDRCHGLWHGQSLRAVPQEDLARYVREEDFAPPQGETGHQFQARIGAWLEQAALQGCVVLVARPPVVRALTVHALGGQSSLTHHLDTEPETASILTHYAGHWRVRQYGAHV